MRIRHLFGEVDLDARLRLLPGADRVHLVIEDEEETLVLDRIEAVFYELVAASPRERLSLLEAGYYLEEAARAEMLAFLVA
jgi:hypothetical protein